MAIGRFIEHASYIYGTDLWDDENAEAKMRTFVNLLAVVECPLALLHGIQEWFIMIQHQCAKATEDLSTLVTKTAKQCPATLKDWQTQELAME